MPSPLLVCFVLFVLVVVAVDFCLSCLFAITGTGPTPVSPRLAGKHDNATKIVVRRSRTRCVLTDCVYVAGLIDCLLSTQPEAHKD
jgi:hypothetical protein